MARPLQRIKVYGVQDRRNSERLRLPWVVRYTIDGAHRSKSYRTRAEAERYRGALLQAVQDGERFDLATGEPESWQLPLAELPIHEWTRRWLAEQWSDWQPRSRTSASEALARFVTLAVRPDSVLPGGLGSYLRSTLGPATEGDRDADLERWLDRNCLTLADLDKGVVSDIARELARRLDGEPLAATTAARYRTNTRACIRAAVEAGAVPTDPWPARSTTRSRRKVSRRKPAVDIRSLPDPATMERALAAIGSHQPGSATYRVMTAVAYYAGLRPSEIAMLRVRALVLPAEGWGRIEVTEADISYDEPGEPKTGARSVPIPQVLVSILRAWLVDNALTEPRDLIFRTRNGTRPTASNWAAPGIGRFDRSDVSRYGCMTAGTQQQRPGFGQVCLWARLHAGWVTASTRSSRPTLARSTVTNRSPTIGSTPRWTCRDASRLSGELSPLSVVESRGVSGG